MSRLHLAIRESRLGEVVTATYQTDPANRKSTAAARSSRPIGTTAAHPFWSVTRQDFVDAGDLEIGEAVVALDGQHFRLTSITPRAGPETVYNFEVALDHVYYVGEGGLLVHNLYLKDLVKKAINKSEQIISVQREAIKKSARKWLNKGPANTHVYVGRINGKIVYVGITKNDIAMRQLQH
ncbi:MAG: polymorphic toxin-type HINT domain-containing protein, partial [Pirellulaceae bacterium]